MRNKYTKSKVINNIVTIIQRGEFAYYSPIAKKYSCNLGALFRRIHGFTKSKKEASSF